jgi:hypothetical protein
MTRPIALPTLLLLLAAGVATAQPAAPPALDADGLEPVAAKNVESASRRPGVDWKRYDRILIQPVNVAFSKSWNAGEYGTFGLTSAEVTGMRTGLADLTQRVFRDVLRVGGFQIADGPGEGVLAVKANIVDLYVNAPEATAAAQRPGSYAMNAGEMRLVLELSDSITGTVLARARDRKQASKTDRLQWAGSGYNRAEAERLLRSWAIQLQNALVGVGVAPGASARAAGPAAAH